MKKIALLLLAVMALTCRAAAPEDLYRTFNKREGAQGMRVGKVALALVKPFNKALRGVDEVAMVNMSECPDKVKQELADSLATIDRSQYSYITQKGDDGEDVAVYMLVRDELLRQVLIVADDGNESFFIFIKGKISPRDFEEMQGMESMFGM